MIDAATRRTVLGPGPLCACTYCSRLGPIKTKSGAPGKGAAVCIDHVVPTSRGGTGDLANLTPACRACNSAKGNRTPEEWARNEPCPRGHWMTDDRNFGIEHHDGLLSECDQCRPRTAKAARDRRQARESTLPASLAQRGVGRRSAVGARNHQRNDDATRSAAS